MCVCEGLSHVLERRTGTVALYANCMWTLCLARRGSILQPKHCAALRDPDDTAPHPVVIPDDLEGLLSNMSCYH